MNGCNSGCSSIGKRSSLHIISNDLTNESGSSRGKSALFSESYVDN